MQKLCSMIFTVILLSIIITTAKHKYLNILPTESADVKQENQQNLSSTHAKMEGLTVVDLTDGEPTISNKTSMESLDNVLNENNSNNTRVEG